MVSDRAVDFGRIPVSGVYERMEAELSRGVRYLVMAGGSRSTKTYSVLQKLIMMCLEAEEPLQINIFRAKLTWLKSTLLIDFKAIMRDQFGLWDEKSMNKTEMFYILNGSRINFVGLDQEAGTQKVHGLKGDVNYFNEAVELEYESVQQILLRQPGIAVFDFNPKCGANHWIYSKILVRRNCGYVHSTYRDNPWLGEEQISEIESYEPTEENVRLGTADETLWKIYGLGERSVVTGLVYASYRLVECFPSGCEKVGLGLDWGFNDPAVGVLCGLKEGGLYVEQVFYRRNLTSIINPHNPNQGSVERELRKSVGMHLPLRTMIWCDGARPDLIRDLQNCGFNAKGARKGPGSILSGIMVVKRHPLFIVESSLDLIREVNNYKWVVDRDGNATNEAVDKFNHGMDAVRYWSSEELGSSASYSGRVDSARHQCVTDTYSEA